MSAVDPVVNALAEPVPSALTASLAVRGALRHIPFRVSAVIRLHGVRLRDLHALRTGRVLMTDFSATDDVPVWVGAAPLAFAELDTVDGQMALRLTRLS